MLWHCPLRNSQITRGLNFSRLVLMSCVISQMFGLICKLPSVLAKVPDKPSKSIGSFKINATRFRSVQALLTYNGTSLSQLNLSQFRHLIGSVMQEPTLFEGTISQNLRFGLEDSERSEEDLIAACRDANILDIIQSSP